MLYWMRCVVQVKSSERKFEFLAAAAGLSAVSLCVYAAVLLGGSPHSPHALDAVILAFIAIIAEEMAVEIRERVTVTAGNLPILLAIMFLGQLPALAVAVVVGLWGAWRESSRAVATYNCANLVISTFVAEEVFSLLQRHFSIPLNSVTPALLLSGAVAAILYEATNNVMTSLGVSGQVRNFAGGLLAGRCCLSTVPILGGSCWLGPCSCRPVCESGHNGHSPPLHPAFRESVHVQAAGA